MVLLMAASFLAYANVAVFFQFYGYLRALAIDPAWYGTIIGTFAAVSLVARPLVTPFIHKGNAPGIAAVGAVLATAALGAYSLADGPWGLLAVRAFHGLAFVVLGGALMAVFIEMVPTDRSAQFFGILSVVVMIPNTIVPPLLPWLDRSLGGFTQVLGCFAALMVLILPLIWLSRPPAMSQGGVGSTGALSRQEIVADLKDRRMQVLLLAMLGLYSGLALVFFFLDGFGRTLGIGGTGLFLTLASGGEIGVRLLAGSLFDRLDKVKLAAGTLAGLALAYAGLSAVNQSWAFFSLGLVIGLGWGIAMPVFNGLIFDLSTPRLRAFNTNLGMQMYQAGFFLGPFIGAPVVVHGGYRSIFAGCALLALVGAGLVWGFKPAKGKAG